MTSASGRRSFSRRSAVIGSSLAAFGAAGIGTAHAADRRAAGPSATPPTSTQVTPEWVVLAADGTGDFGPDTPGTTTAGWQEAIDYAHSVQNSPSGSPQTLLVKGGGPFVVYHVSETIRIPASQDWAILSAGEYVLNWTGSQTDRSQHFMVIDSAENCHYELGIFSYKGQGACILLQPKNPVPVDGFIATTELHLYVEAMTDGHPFSPGVTPAGNGVVFDASFGPFVWNTLDLYEVTNFTTNILINIPPSDQLPYFNNPGGFTQPGFESNDLAVTHFHTNRSDSTMLSMAYGCVANDFRFLASGVDQNATGATAIEVAGLRNHIEFKTRPSTGPFAANRTIVFDQSAAENRVDYVPHGAFDLPSEVTDNAAVPTNQIITPSPQPASTVSLGQGQSYTQRLFPAAVTAHVPLTLTRGTSRTAVPSGSGVVLSVGDQLTTTTGGPTTLTVVPIRTM